MIAAANYSQFRLRRSRWSLIWQLWASLVVALVAINLAIVPWMALVTVCMAILAAVLALLKYRCQVDELLIFSGASTFFAWRLVASNERIDLHKKPRCWVTKALIIVYFERFSKRALLRFIPRDAMSMNEHRRLRRLLLELSRRGE